MKAILVLWKKCFPCFFDDSLKLLHNLETVLNKEPVDYRKLDAHLHHIKGSSSRHANCSPSLFYIWLLPEAFSF
ncbi:hypothetical protein SUGI_0606080 [Cryptomeria japonica]|nr:hypothetical protein SUGI_0606080 [Cryptomeria japonica]